MWYILTVDFSERGKSLQTFSDEPCLISQPFFMYIKSCKGGVSIEIRIDMEEEKA